MSESKEKSEEERYKVWNEARQKAHDEWRQEYSEKLYKRREPVEAVIHEMFMQYEIDRATFCKFQRKSGKERYGGKIIYVSPQIRLHWYFLKYLERTAIVFEGKVSIHSKERTWRNFENEDALLIVLPKPRPVDPEVMEKLVKDCKEILQGRAKPEEVKEK